jgi:hypothetical protein
VAVGRAEVPGSGNGRLEPCALGREEQPATTRASATTPASVAPCAERGHQTGDRHHRLGSGAGSWGRGKILGLSVGPRPPTHEAGHSDPWWQQCGTTELNRT